MASMPGTKALGNTLPPPPPAPCGDTWVCHLVIALKEIV